MKNIRVVIGANFGDEGKGLMTDYFCQHFENPVLNVRFNGTCQAGHTVVQGEKRHVFSHFGAGSFNSNVTTYLSSFFYVNPILFVSEYYKLKKLGINPKVIIAKDAPVVTFFDMAFNRLKETSRGKNRHGSCGLGLWESVVRDREGCFITVDDLRKSPMKLAAKLYEIRDNYYGKKAKDENIDLNYDLDGINWYDENIISAYIDDAKRMCSLVQFEDESVALNQFDSIVFEGAQGLLLDWQNREYMPHLTASRTGSFNVNQLLNKIEEPIDLEVCYITRSYFTRHGAGFFKTEVRDKEVLGLTEDDKTNVLNTWQGYFRYGYFDMPLFKKTLERDLFDLKDKKLKKSICVSHLDETDGKIKEREKDITIEEFGEEFVGWNIYLANSPESAKIKVFERT